MLCVLVVPIFGLVVYVVQTKSCNVGETPDHNHLACSIWYTKGTQSQGGCTSTIGEKPGCGWDAYELIINPTIWYFFNQEVSRQLASWCMFLLLITAMFDSITFTQAVKLASNLEDNSRLGIPGVQRASSCYWFLPGRHFLELKVTSQTSGCMM